MFPSPEMDIFGGRRLPEQGQVEEPLWKTIEVVSNLRVVLVSLGVVGIIVNDGISGRAGHPLKNLEKARDCIVGVSRICHLAASVLSQQCGILAEEGRSQDDGRPVPRPPDHASRFLATRLW